MKKSIRTKFTLGLVFLFVIIMVLSVFSGYYMNLLAKKTGAILKENYLSVVYARDMSEGLFNISNEFSRKFLNKKSADSILIRNELSLINKGLESEKNNITEPGEGKLVSEIEFNLREYRDSVSKYLNSQMTSGNLLFLNDISGMLQLQIIVLSQLNGNAMEAKTDEAKIASNNALTQMTILGTLCFLIALTFIYSFATYFSQRFFQLYNGIKEIVSSNYDQHLNFEGKDEFYDLSLVFNEMADKLKQNKKEISVTLPKEINKGSGSSDISEVRLALKRLQQIEEQTTELLSRLEKSK